MLAVVPCGRLAAQNDLPRPASTTTRYSVCALSAENRSPTSRIISWLCALRDSGRFNQTRNVSPSGSSSMVSNLTAAQTQASSRSPSLPNCPPASSARCEARTQCAAIDASASGFNAFTARDRLPICTSLAANDEHADAPWVRLHAEHTRAGGHMPSERSTRDRPCERLHRRFESGTQCAPYEL